MTRLVTLQLLALAPLALVSCGLAVGVSARVTNSSGGDVKDVVLAFTGGEEHVPEIKAGTTHRVRLNPDGASSLHLKYTDAGGTIRTNNAGMYFGPGFRGGVEIDIGPNGTVTYKDLTKI